MGVLGGATALLPMFAKVGLQVGPTGPGLRRAAPAVGALVRSPWLARHPLVRRTGPRLLAAPRRGHFISAVTSAMRSPKARAVAMSPGTISSAEASDGVVVIRPANEAT